MGISIADIAAGMYAYTGVLTALIQRNSTGTGATVDVSLFDALAEWMGFPALYAAYTGKNPPRSGPNHISIAPYGPFAASDGHVCLSIQNVREWERFCEDVLEQPAVAADDRFRSNELRVRHRDELKAIIEQVFTRLTLPEVERRLEAAQIANARMNSMTQFLEHPQLTERGRWTEIGSEAGPLRALPPPVAIEDVGPVMGDVPALGQHTGAVLKELGFDAETIARWQKEAVI